jgi:hypothetical protein
MAPVDVLLAFQLVLAPFQRRVRLLPGFPIQEGHHLGLGDELPVGKAFT